MSFRLRLRPSSLAYLSQIRRRRPSSARSKTHNFATKKYYSTVSYLAVLPILLFPAVTGAAVEVVPAVLNEKARARDMLKYSVELYNNSNRAVELYPFVNDIDASGVLDYGGGARADRRLSLAGWIKLSRASIMLAPQERRRVEFSIDVSVQALPGTRNAVITFAEGRNMTEAEKNIRGSARALINLEILENVKENLLLKNFTPRKVFFTSFPVSFTYELENAGNRAVSHSGEIRIYDRRGREINTIKIAEEKSIGPDEKIAHAKEWDPASEETNAIAAALQGIASAGRYKAFLDLRYGGNSRGTVQDTIFFWVIPLPLIMIFTGTVFALASMMIYLLSYPRRKVQYYGNADYNQGAAPAAVEPSPAKTERKKIVRSISLLIALLPAAVYMYLSPFAFADSHSLSISITPPLFQLSLEPGEAWKSSIKVVNTNAYDLSIHATVMDFKAFGERGQGRVGFLDPTDNKEMSDKLGHWITVPDGPLTIPKGQSREIPFSIKVPANAPPGGHYAAILIGNKPDTAENSGAMLQISSMISTLVFLRVAGEVVEDGDIREFYADKAYYQTPEVPFTLRFENRGNVHLQPQGEIVIYNMWGRERGKIPINQKTNFGNVLPQSSRVYQFTWKGESNFFEAGRYKAVAALAYGEGYKKHADLTTYFWIVPVMPILSIGSGTALILVLLTWGVRAYVRRVVAAAQKDAGLPVTNPAFHAYVRPIKDGVIDLRKIRMQKEADIPSLTPVSFLRKYAFLFALLGSILFGIGGVWMFAENAFKASRNYSAIINKEDGKDITLTAEDIENAK